MASACGGTAAGAPVGYSMQGAAPRASATAAPATADVPRDYRRELTVLGRESFSARGHFGGRYVGSVLANAGGGAAWAKQDVAGTYPLGALLVMEHRTSAGLESLFSMRKVAEGAGASTWRFQATDARGLEIGSTDAVERCVSCHSNAPRDFVFYID